MTDAPPQDFHGCRHRARTAGPFTLSQWTANRLPPQGNHFHEQAHFLFVTSGRYVNTADESCCLHYHPAQTEHADHLHDGRGSFVAISMTPMEYESDVDRELPQAAAPVRGTRAFMAGVRLTRALIENEGGPFMLEALCFELIEANSSRSTRAESGQAPWLKHAREQLSEPISQPRSLDELCRSLGIHPVHLTRCFRRAYGCTPAEYARAVRLRAATDRITNGREGLKEIATAFGFFDQSHLTNLVRRAYGMTPAQLRASTSTPADV